MDATEFYEQEAEAIAEARQQMNWRSRFDVRELKVIESCRGYLERFGSGSDEHRLRIIVAKLATILDET